MGRKTDPYCTKEAFWNGPDFELKNVIQFAATSRSAITLTSPGPAGLPAVAVGAAPAERAAGLERAGEDPKMLHPLTEAISADVNNVPEIDLRVCTGPFFAVGHRSGS